MKKYNFNPHIMGYNPRVSKRKRGTRTIQEYDYCMDGMIFGDSFVRNRRIFSINRGNFLGNWPQLFRQLYGAFVNFCELLVGCCPVVGRGGKKRISRIRMSGKT